MDKLLRFLLWTGGILAGLIALGRLFLFEGWTIPDDPYLAASIAPTLQAGDYVLVLTRGESDFGDLVRCPDPDDTSRWVIGRIAGLGGDEVEVQGPLLRVNGRSYTATEACTDPTFEVAHPDTGSTVELRCSRVEMGGGWHFRGTLGKSNPSNDHKKSVGTGNVYLLSDNRDLHEDSRDFGTVPHASCHQRIFFRLWGAAGWSDAASRLTLIR